MTTDIGERGLIIREEAPLTVVMQMEQMVTQVKTIDSFYRRIMTEGTDYGVIPGTPKPSLFQPGAELLRLAFNLVPHFEIVDRNPNAPPYSFTVRCTLSRHGAEVGDAIASCTTDESRYKFRWVGERELPAGIDKGALLKQERTSKTGGRWTVYQLENPNPADQANTVLQMAEKRAFVRAIRQTTGASRIFTQDIEDIIDAPVAVKAQPQRAAPKAEKPTNPEPESHVAGGDAEAAGERVAEKRAERMAEAELSISMQGFDGDEAETDAMPDAGQAEQASFEYPRDPETVKFNTLYTACYADYGVKPPEVLAILGLSADEITSANAPECYRTVAAGRKPLEKLLRPGRTNAR